MLLRAGPLAICSTAPARPGDPSPARRAACADPPLCATGRGPRRNARAANQCAVTVYTKGWKVPRAGRRAAAGDGAEAPPKTGRVGAQPVRPAGGRGRATNGGLRNLVQRFSRRVCAYTSAMQAAGLRGVGAGHRGERVKRMQCSSVCLAPHPCVLSSKRVRSLLLLPCPALRAKREACRPCPVRVWGFKRIGDSRQSDFEVRRGWGPRLRLHDTLQDKSVFGI